MPLGAPRMQQNSAHQDLEIPLAAVIDDCLNLKPAMLEPRLDQPCSACRMLRTMAGAPDDSVSAIQPLGPSARIGGSCAVDGVPHRLLPARLVAQPEVTGHAVRSRVTSPRVHQHAVDRDVEDAEIVRAVVVSNLPDVDVRKPAPNQLCVPSRGLVEMSVVAILKFDKGAGIRTLGIVAEHVCGLYWGLPLSQSGPLPFPKPER